jgi:hypothetical protein
MLLILKTKIVVILVTVAEEKLLLFCPEMSEFERKVSRWVDN